MRFLGNLLSKTSKSQKRFAKEIEILRQSPLLDPIWYRQYYSDLRDAPLDVARHYLEHGAHEGRNPHPLFDTKYYVEQNPDVAKSGLNPLVHFELHGAEEGRNPHPQYDIKYYLAWVARRGASIATESLESRHDALSEDLENVREAPHGATASNATDLRIITDVDWIRQSDLFDENFYLAENPDVRSAHMDSALHYLIYGGKEGRNPSPLFCGAKYLKLNDDVRESGINPLLHWLKYGRFERRQFPFLDKPAAHHQLAYYCNIHRVEDQYTRYYDEQFFISVLTPAYNTPPAFLSELLITLQNQRYSNWEWIVVDDGSTVPDTIATLKLMAKNERRLRVTFKENGGISSATNTALSLARGTHFALVDHDDLLSRDAFFLIWTKWKDDPSTDLFYTDECKILADYGLYAFSHKPAWSPFYLENTMYIGHLSVYRRETIEAAGGFRSAFDGTQDFDLALRMSGDAKKVCHIPEVCYFWRAIEGSTAATLNSKSYALERQKAAVLEYARNKNPRAEVLPGWSLGFWHVDYPLDREPPLVSYVIPTAGRSRLIRGIQTDLIEQCIRNLEAQEFYPHREFVVVHNGDLNQTQLDFLATIEGLVLVEYHPKRRFNFSEKLNLGVSRANGEYLCILNDDIEVITPRGGMHLVGFLDSNPAVGAIGPLLTFEDGRLQHNGIVLTASGPTHSGIFKEAEFSGNSGYLRCRREAFGISGALMFVRKRHYDAVNGFNEIFPINYNDVDFCLKLREEGLSCVVDPNVVAYHFEASSKTGTFPCEKERFDLEWGELNDPFFNVNFNQNNPYYELKLPDDRSCQRIDNDSSSFQIWMNREITRRNKRCRTSETYKLTVAVPIYNQPAAFLNELLISIELQTYANMELVVVDDASTEPGTIRWIEELESSGIAKVIRHKTNQGISGANRSAVKAMSGDFILLVDADDYLTVDALAVMASYIESHPEAQLFYSDEFKSDTESRQFNPFFKPDFDPVLLSNCCYPTHLMAIGRRLLNEIDAYSDNRATWCHDYDTLTRALARGIQPVHVPEMLYAWRISPGSTAAAGHEAKPQTIASQRFVLERLLRDLGKASSLQIEANPLFSHLGMWRLKHRQSTPLPAVELLDGNAFLVDAGEKALGELNSLAQSKKGPEWIAILDDLANHATLLSELFAVALFHSDVVAVSGLICDEDEKFIIWSGGFFTTEATILDPYAGSELHHGGYHGQLYCQRCVDVPAPMNILLKKDFLSRTLSKFEISSYKNLMVALGIEAMLCGKYVAVTPHVRHLAPAPQLFPFPDDREGLLAGASGVSSRWYNPKLPALTSQAYHILGRQFS